MQKILKMLLEIIGGVLFVGFTLQIILGILWMFANIKSIYSLISLVWVGIAFWAAFKMVHVFFKCNIYLRVWGSLVITSFPFAMQIHMQDWRLSVLCSCLMLGLSFVLETKLCFLIPCGIAIILAPEYGFFSALLAICYLISAGRKDHPGSKKIIFRALGLCGIIVLCQLSSIGIRNIPVVEEKLLIDDSGVADSINEALLRRFMWPEVQQNYGVWPEAAKKAVKYEKAVEYNKYPATFAAKLIKNLNKKNEAGDVNAICRELAYISIRNNTSGILHDIFRDAAGYGLSPCVVLRQLDGRSGESYTGINYDSMREKSPELTSFYIRYSCYWFVFALAFTVLCRALRAGDRRGINKSRLIYSVLLCSVMVAFYTLQGAGIMDYRRTVFVTAMWLVFMTGTTCFALGGINENKA